MPFCPNVLKLVFKGYFLTFPGANKVTQSQWGYISEPRISHHKWRAVKIFVPSIPSISGQQTWDEATMAERDGWPGPHQECGDLRLRRVISVMSSGDENLVCFASTLGMWDMAGIWSIRGTMLVKIWCSSGADIWHRPMVTTWGGEGSAVDPGGPYLGLN